MHCTEIALGKVSLPPKLCCILSKAVHVQFDSSSYEGHPMGRFVILDGDSLEFIWARWYYGVEYTNNKAKSFALWGTLQCLTKLVQEQPAFRYYVQLCGNSRLIIFFLTCIFKWSQHHSIYWSIEEARAAQWA